MTTPYFVDAVGFKDVGWIFILYGGITVLGTIFVFFFMKETRNKSIKEIEMMYIESESK